ncbi:pilus assembly protein [bacterium]|nr:pilus assembly protein [bacterium]
MKRYCIVLTALIAGIFLLSGCACTTSSLKMDYGKSFGLAKTGQILNPESGKNLEPVQGIDGQAAMKAMEKFQDGFGSCSSSGGGFESGDIMTKAK